MKTDFNNLENFRAKFVTVSTTYCETKVIEIPDRPARAVRPTR